MKKKKLLTVIICCATIFALIISAAAYTKYKYTEAKGSSVSKIINRVNIEVTNTEFTFSDVENGGMMTCKTNVKMSKTEPDFYGKIDSITLSGADFGYTMYTAGKNNAAAELPENVILPVKDGKPSELSWDITFTVPYEKDKNQYDITLKIAYTSGVKTTATQQYLTEIPVIITVK